MINHLIRIFNTLTRSKEAFIPLHEGRATIYQCGPTVYWTQHIGNLRAMVVGDLVVRTFRYLGYETKYVRNYTDVGHLTSDEDEGEDKMAKGARREGLAPHEIADKYIGIFEHDTRDLNLAEPDVKPRATECIKEMQDMIQTLIDKGYAYTTPLAVYFDVTKADNYTALSGQRIEKNIGGAGSGEISDTNKRNAPDFALWFFKAGKHKFALQTWPSPFYSPEAQDGEGFPGWHIECSAMSKKFLGDTIDIHIGGIEHVSVHHTNEIAQSEAANGAKFVNYWMHNEHLLVNGGKMAKSEGTGFSLNEVKEKGFTPLSLRFFFLGAHYRSKQNFTWEALEGARSGLQHLYNQVRELRIKNYELGSIEIYENLYKYKQKFINAITDDFNTPQALAVVQEILKSELPANDKYELMIDFDRILGLDIRETLRNEELPDDIRALASERKRARDEKDWGESDRLRRMIEDRGYSIEDAVDGTRIIKKP